MGKSFWQGRRVLVTGANGFVGSWLCQRLLKEGAAVVALIRDQIPGANFYRLGLERRCDIVAGGVEDFALLSRTVAEYEVESCFHLAAQAIVGVANHSPLSTFEANVRGTWNLLEAMRLGKRVRAVIIASSDKAYGCHEELPYTEDTPLQPLYPYDTSKACADFIARSFFHTFGVPVAVTRFANIYGGGDLNFSRIVPGTIRSVLQGEDPIIRSDGTPERDFISVDDVVELYLEIGRRLPADGVSGGVFNGGHNRPVKVLDLVEKIIALSGKKGVRPDIRGKSVGHGEIDRQWLGAMKAKEVLGWEPKVGFDQGLARTIEWYRELLADDSFK
jgi:CDP-glucose 4,6-dehydratase